MTPAPTPNRPPQTGTDPFTVADPAARIDRLYLMRHAVHRCLRLYGNELFDDEREYLGTLTATPSITTLPAEQQSWRHAAEEASRLADAHLYGLDQAATADAVALGAKMRPHLLADNTTARTADGTASKICRAWTRAARPPAEAGLLRWAGGVGHDGIDIPVIACHWGPAPEGTWLYWWTDQRIAINTTMARDGRPHHDPQELLHKLGPLGFGHMAAILVPHPDDDLVQAPPAHGLDAELLALTGIVLASWALLTAPGPHLHTREPDTRAAVRDCRAGLKPRPATLATGPIDTQPIPRARRPASSMQALDSLADQARVARKSLDDALEDADLLEVSDALNSLLDLFDGIQPMMASLYSRTDQIRKDLIGHREDIDTAESAQATREHREDPDEPVDSALVSLGLANDTMETVYHLIVVGRRELPLAAHNKREKGESGKV